MLDATRVKDWHADSNKVLTDAAAQFENVDALVLTDSMCGESLCSTIINGEFLYSDSNHIRMNLRTETIAALAEMSGIQGWFRRNLTRYVFSEPPPRARAE
jgi:hypothetical protein